MNYTTHLYCPYCDHSETKCFQLMDEPSFHDNEFIVHCAACDDPYYLHFEVHGNETSCSVHRIEGVHTIDLD